MCAVACEKILFGGMCLLPRVPSCGRREAGASGIKAGLVRLSTGISGTLQRWAQLEEAPDRLPPD